MPRKTTAQPKPKSGTHFEQVPVEVVKKIAEVTVPKDRKTYTADNVMFESATDKVEPYSVRAESLSRRRPSCDVQPGRSADVPTATGTAPYASWDHPSR